MKVLGVSGSPRQEGNTDYAVRRTLDFIAEKMPKASVDFTRVSDYRIEHCRGCRHCMKAVECIIKDDDLNILVDKMLSADLIILGAPVYWWGPPGVMKDLIDRTHGFYPDTERFSGKRVALISVAANSGYPSLERTLSWLEHYGAEVVAKVRLRAREMGELKRRKSQIRRLDAFSKRLVELIS